MVQRDEDDISGWRTIEGFKQSLATVTLKNASPYAAKNPGVRIELEGLGGLSEQQGWETVTFATLVGITAIQWDGGTDSIIHERWSRALPSLDLSDIKELGSSAGYAPPRTAPSACRRCHHRYPARGASQYTIRSIQYPAYNIHHISLNMLVIAAIDRPENPDTVRPGDTDTLNGPIPPDNRSPT